MSGSQFRPDPYVVTRFFDRLKRSRTDRLKKTHLQTATGLNWAVFSRYLEMLLGLGLLELEEEGKDIYVRATPKGREIYLSLESGLQELLRGQR